MRVLAAALAVLLLVAICSLAEANHGGSRNAEVSKQHALTEINPISCCFSFISRPVPRRMIHSAYRTSDNCPTQAVVLVSRKGRQLCVDPRAHWVQKYLQDLELQEY